MWGKTRIAAYQESARTSTATSRSACSTIPSIELEAPIFDGTSELTLNRGIGRIEGTADVGAAGNLGLAGHRDGFFRGLKDVEVGDTINVESLDGTTRYRITELSIVEPTDVHVLAPTDTATLTLVTCYPFYFIGEAPQRYIVKGVAESPTRERRSSEPATADAADPRTREGFGDRARSAKRAQKNRRRIPATANPSTVSSPPSAPASGSTLAVRGRVLEATVGAGSEIAKMMTVGAAANDCSGSSGTTISQRSGGS